MIAQVRAKSKRFAQKRSGKFVPSAERAPVRLAQGGAQDGGAVRRHEVARADRKPQPGGIGRDARLAKLLLLAGGKQAYA